MGEGEVVPVFSQSAGFGLAGVDLPSTLWLRRILPGFVRTGETPVPLGDTAKIAQCSGFLPGVQGSKKWPVPLSP